MKDGLEESRLEAEKPVKRQNGWSELRQYCIVGQGAGDYFN